MFLFAHHFILNITIYIMVVCLTIEIHRNDKAEGMNNSTISTICSELCANMFKFDFEGPRFFVHPRSNLKLSHFFL